MAAGLLLLSCGGSRVPSTPSSTPLPPITGGDGARTQVPEEGQEARTAGPSSSIPETVYAPFLRRSQTPAPSLPGPANDCHLAVEVRGYDGLDGCGLLLETDGGALLLAANTPRGEPLEAGTRILIGYEYQPKDATTTCTNVDAVVYITCLRLLRISSGLPRPVVCEAYTTPSRWLYDLAINLQASYVTRFPWQGGRYVYLLETPNGQFLYDCRGYLLCSPRKNCLSFIEDYSQGLLIFEGS